LRWWDGAAWTDNVHDDSATQQPSSYGQVLTAPEGTNPNTVWVWILALMPLLALVSLVFFNPAAILPTNFDATDPSAALNAEFAIFTTPYFLSTLLLGAVEYALFIVFGLLDFRRLKALGVPKPFHWAFTFIPSYGYLIYMIGRFVIVRRRTGTGLRPLWLWIGVYVVTLVVVVAVTLVISASYMSTFASTLGNA
jgi:hypothetical protein